MQQRKQILRRRCGVRWWLRVYPYGCGTKSSSVIGSSRAVEYSLCWSSGRLDSGVGPVAGSTSTTGPRETTAISPASYRKWLTSITAKDDLLQVPSRSTVSSELQQPSRQLSLAGYTKCTGLKLYDTSHSSCEVLIRGNCVLRGLARLHTRLKCTGLRVSY